MELPDYLRKNIEKEVEGNKLKSLRDQTAKLSQLYRDRDILKSYMSSRLDRLAYILFRMPATFAAVNHILHQLSMFLKNDIKSIIDIGSGPGTATFAALEHFSIDKATLIEKDIELINLCKRLSHFDFFDYQAKDYSLLTSMEYHDLAIISYSIGENKNFKSILELCLQSCNIITIIEPGTPKGYERLMNVRDFFIEKGANILAPCPHNLKCPLIAPNWCHFTQRLQRTKLHKEAKSATLGYEDEKFSYLIVSKQLRTLNSNRILTKPKHRGGHIEFDICTNKGTHESVIISKKNKDLYSIAKKKEWSDLLDLY